MGIHPQPYIDCYIHAADDTGGSTVCILWMNTRVRSKHPWTHYYPLNICGTTNWCPKHATPCVESRLVLRFEIWTIFVASRTKVCKNPAFSAFLHSDAMNNGHIKNRRPGRRSVHKLAYFISGSTCCTANTQVLNRSESCGDLHILKTRAHHFLKVWIDVSFSRDGYYQMQ